MRRMSSSLLQKVLRILTSPIQVEHHILYFVKSLNFLGLHRANIPHGSCSPLISASSNLDSIGDQGRDFSSKD